MQKLGVMRFAMSTEISVSRVPPSSGATMLEIVGSDSSSAMNGSSVESVAGKKRLPAKPCEKALFVETTSAANKAAPGNAARNKIQIGIERTKTIFICELLCIAQQPRISTRISAVLSFTRLTDAGD